MTPFDKQIQSAREAHIESCILYFIDAHPTRQSRMIKLNEGDLGQFMRDGNRFVRMIGDIPVYETSQPRGSLTEIARYSPS